MQFDLRDLILYLGRRNRWYTKKYEIFFLLELHVMTRKNRYLKIISKDLKIIKKMYLMIHNFKYLKIITKRLIITSTTLLISIKQC